MPSQVKVFWLPSLVSQLTAPYFKGLFAIELFDKIARHLVTVVRRSLLKFAAYGIPCHALYVQTCNEQVPENNEPTSKFPEEILNRLEIIWTCRRVSGIVLTRFERF